MYKLNFTFFLQYQWAKKERKKEIGKYLEVNEGDNTINQNL